MKAIRALLLSLTALSALSGADTASAALVKNTFYDCGFDITCSATPSVLLQFVTDDFMRAPAVPLFGTITPVEAVDVSQFLQGRFDAFGLSTFNINNAIGSQFVANGLMTANGRVFSSVMAFAPVTRAALQLDWLEGTHQDLGYVNCINASCSAQSQIRGFSKLVVELVQDEPENNRVPEPQSLALVFAALAAVVGTSARRRQGQAGRD